MLAASLSILGFISSSDAIIEAFDFLGLEIEDDYETEIIMAASVAVPATVSACDSMAYDSVMADDIEIMTSEHGDSERICARSTTSQGYRDTGQHTARSGAILTASRLPYSVIHPKAYTPPGKPFARSEHWISALTSFYT